MCNSFITQFSQMHSEKLLRGRRVHTNSEDNIRLSENRRTSFRPNRVRLNTIQNEQELLLKKHAATKLLFKPIVSPTKYYETKLILSCETWSAHSVSENRYRRGWRPTKKAEFNGFLRIMIAREWFQLSKKHQWVEKVGVRVNQYLLRQEQRRRSLPLCEQLKERQKQAKLGNPYVLAENTVINLKDLIMANLFSSYDELNEYAVIFLGALLLDIQQGKNSCRGDLYSFQEPEEGAAVQGLSDAIRGWVKHANGSLQADRFECSRVGEDFGFESSPEEMACLFAGMVVRQPEFLKVVSRREVSAVIKYQMGYRFYEQRKIRFVHEWPTIADHLVIKCRGSSNFGVVSYNKTTHNIVVLNDCKFKMEETDLKKIQDLLMLLAKPIVQKKQKTSTVRLLPLLKLIE